MSSKATQDQLWAESLLLVGIRGGLVLLLAMPLIVTTETLFPFIVGKSVFGRVIIEIVFAMWLVAAILYPKHRLPRSWLLVAFGVYVLINLLAGVTGVSFQRSLWSTYERMQGTVDLVHWLMLTTVLAAAFRSFSDWRFFLNVNLVVSLMVALLGVAQRYDVGVGFYDYLPSEKRLGISFGNPTYVGAYMMVNIFVGLALLGQSFGWGPTEAVSRAVRRRRRRGDRQQKRDYWLFGLRLFWVAIIALDFWILWLSGTRGAVIGLAAGLVAFAGAYLAWGQLRLVKYIAVGVVAVLVTLGLFMAFARNSSVVDRLAASNAMVSRIRSIGLDDPSSKGRFDSVILGLRGFMARPILGWGPENYLVPWGRYFDGEEGEVVFDQAHNKVIEELTTKGIVGLVSYLSLWAILLTVLYRRARSPDARHQIFTLLIASALIGYFVQNLFLFDTPATMLQFMVLLAFAVSVEVAETDGPVKDRSGAEQNTAIPVGRWSGPVRRAASWIDSTWARLGTTATRLQESRSRAAMPLSVFVIVLGLVASIYFLNFRAYDAARTVLQVGHPDITWNQRLTVFEHSIDAFPPLANSPRQLMLNTLSKNWNSLTADEARAALVKVDEAARRALEAEPKSWRMNAKIAEIYLRSSTLDPDNLPLARSYLDRALELAPHVPEVTRIEAEFENSGPR